MAERDGIIAVGAVTIIRRRDSEVEENYNEALRAGAVSVLTEAILMVEGLIASAGPYDDTRMGREVVTWMQDKIRLT